MLSRRERQIKRTFDIILSVLLIILLWWLIFLAWIISSWETKSNGMFMQKRIGKEGKPFFVWKIKTMKPLEGISTTVTTSSDERITQSGAFFRKTKIDELPQLFNVLLGNMSFVGPRPDVSGFADKLVGDECNLLSLYPGITGPASLKYRDEENILAKQKDPERYNREIIWPDKVKINLVYFQNWTLKKDIIIMIKTVLG